MKLVLEDVHDVGGERFIGKADRPAEGILDECFGEAAGEGETKPQAAVVVGVAEALDRRERLIALILRDARTSVDHPQLETVAERAASHVHRLVVR